MGACKEGGHARRSWLATCRKRTAPTSWLYIMMLPVASTSLSNSPLTRVPD